MAWDKGWGLWGGTRMPVWLCLTRCLRPPVLEAMTGVAQAMDSKATRPKDSWEEGIMVI